MTANKRDQGLVGSPGKRGKQGVMGPIGLQGETGNKGEKGDMGSAGMPGTKGEPGESISSPAVVVSPVKLTVNEGGTASFQCSASGNPEPAVSWSKLYNQSQITQLPVSGGKLELNKVTGNDSGVHQCSATNILGNSQEVVRLAVNGEFLILNTKIRFLVQCIVTHCSVYKSRLQICVTKISLCFITVILFVGQDMSCPRKLFLTQRKSRFSGGSLFPETSGCSLASL